MQFRNVELILTSSVCSILVAIFSIFAFNPMTSFYKSPCWLECFSFTLFAPLAIYIYLLRVNHLIFVNCISKIKSSSAASKDKNILQMKFSLVEKFSLLYFRILFTNTLSRKSYQSNHNIMPTQIQLKDWTLVLALLPCIIVGLIMFLIVASTNPKEMTTIGTCNSSIYYPLFTWIIVMLLIWFTSLLTMFNIQNGLGIKAEYTTGAIVCLFPYSFLIAAIVSGNPYLQTRYGITIYIVLMDILSQTMFVFVPLVILVVDMNRVKEIELIVDQGSLERVINTPLLFTKFKGALAKEFASENGFFIEDYKKLLEGDKLTIRGSNVSRNMNAKFAIVDIFEKYVQSGAAFQLNLNEQTVKG